MRFIAVRLLCSNSSSDCWLSNNVLVFVFTSLNCSKSLLMAAISVDSWISNPTQFRPSSQKFSLHHNDRMLRCKFWPKNGPSLTPTETANTAYNAIHAHCDIVLAILSVRPSVCPSVRHTLVLCLNDCTYRQTFTTIWQGMTSFWPTATKFGTIAN